MEGRGEGGRMWCKGGVVLTYCPLAFIGGWPSLYVSDHFLTWAVGFISGWPFLYMGSHLHMWTFVWVVISIHEQSSLYVGGWWLCSWSLSLSSSWWQWLC